MLLGNVRMTEGVKVDSHMRGWLGEIYLLISVNSDVNQFIAGLTNKPTNQSHTRYPT